MLLLPLAREEVP